jgi:asparagine N-glycosylation enzyme membrane subunit Stt3
MLFDTILAILIGFLTLFIPGVLVALALLKDTKLHIIEIIIIGFIFGFMELPTLTWIEAYLMNTIHFFTFSLMLNYVNFIILTIFGIILCIWQGVFKDFKKKFIIENKVNVPKWAWIVLILVLISVFITRFVNIRTSPTFFEFDPYFDMISTQYILTYGQQIPFDHAAWPAISTGVNHRMEPLIPYVEAYWYDIANSLGPHLSTLSTTMLSLVSSYYPPIAAVLLVFVIFMILYHEYDWRVGLIGAGLTATMPVIITTFIAGEQLLEPWGIFAMFFFIAAYMLAVKNIKSKRLAILASIAFISNFIGAHYYTVTVAILALYIILQGIINFFRDENIAENIKSIDKNFYIMNGIIILTTIIFFIFYYPYGSTLQNRTPTALGIPSPISYPLLALIFVAMLQYLPLYLKKYLTFLKENNLKAKASWFAIIIVLAIILILFTNIKNSFAKYLELSVHFTTPSSPLFMTVQEYVPTGLTYNFGAGGLGIIAASIGNFPLILWVVIILSILLLLLKIIDENSKTSILYIAISVPLLLAGFSEVKYLPHFGIAYILLFSIMIGEFLILVDKRFEFKFISKNKSTNENNNKDYTYLRQIILSIALFAISSILAVLYLLYLYLGNTLKEKKYKNYMLYTAIFFVVLTGIVVGVTHSFPYGESSSYIDVTGSSIIAFTTPQSPLWNNNVCSALQNRSYSIGMDLFCNQVPNYWLNAMAWLRNNVGPNAPRVLSWWDYGDWINWYGNSYAVLRGDNADPKEDYAVAAQYVLGSKDNYTPQVLANYMNGNQTEYALFDEDLIGKWGALDFLGCVHVNETSYQYAVEQGQAQNPPVPYQLGTSKCELNHDPQYAFIPLAVLEPNVTNTNINYYCSISNSTTKYAISVLTPGINQSNQTIACVDLNPTSNGAVQLYTQKGVKMNAFLWPSPLGITLLQGIPMVQYMLIYTPNGANGIITDAPTEFYLSNYYKAFFLGNLPGFTEVYPQNNQSGVNFINYTDPVRIYKLNNYTGGLPPSTPKPSWIKNNYSIPG